MQRYHCKDCTDAEAHNMFCLSPVRQEVQAKVEIHDIGKHLRKYHRLDIRLAESDSHGHSWYCFSCNSKSGKNHRSFDSDQALFDHLRTVHGLHMRSAGGPQALRHETRALFI